MAQPEPKRIMELDLAGPLTSSDTVAIVQGTITKRTPISNFRPLFDDGCECTLVSRYTTMGTDANTQLKYLYTYTLPANVMTVDGSYLEVHAAGLFAGNGNSKYVAIELRDGGTPRLITPIPDAVYNGTCWLISIKYQRAGELLYVASEYVSVCGCAGGALDTPQVLHGFIEGNAVDWTGGEVQICVVAQNGTASANDVICNSFIIDAHMMDPNS